MAVAPAVGRAADALCEVNLAVVSKAFDEGPAACVQGHQITVPRGHVDSRIIPCLPIGHAAADKSEVGRPSR